MSTRNDARRERKKATNAALYLKNVASGKQKLYQSNNRDKRREKSILKKLPESKRHLLESVLKILSAEIKAGRKSSPRLIESSIYKCERECERSLAASASGRSDDDNAVSSTNAESGTATSMEESANSSTDAPDAHRPPPDGNTGRSDALAALAEVAAAAESIEAEAGQPDLPPLTQQAAQQMTTPAPVPPQEPEQGNAIVDEDDVDDDYDDNNFDGNDGDDGDSRNLQLTCTHIGSDLHVTAADTSTPTPPAVAAATPAAAEAATKSNLREILDMLRSDDEADDEDLFE